MTIFSGKSGISSAQLKAKGIDFESRDTEHGTKTMVVMMIMIRLMPFITIIFMTMCIMTFHHLCPIFPSSSLTQLAADKPDEGSSSEAKKTSSGVSDLETQDGWLRDRLERVKDTMLVCDT